MDTKTPKILDYDGLAEKLGISRASARTYNGRATYNRRMADATGNKKWIRPGDLPEPDMHVGQSPAWHESTIDAWLAKRPGQGVHENASKPRKRRTKKGSKK